MLDLYVQGLGTLRGVGYARDVVVGGITPALVAIDPTSRCSRVVEHVALQVEVGVETLPDSLVCGLRCKAFVSRVFSCSIKHYFAYLSLFSLFKLLFSPFPSFTLGDLLYVSILDLVPILGSTGGWFPCTIFWSLV